MRGWREEVELEGVEGVLYRVEHVEEWSKWYFLILEEESNGGQ